jgi:hypothetical protein
LSNGAALADGVDAPEASDADEPHGLTDGDDAESAVAAQSSDSGADGAAGDAPAAHEQTAVPSPAAVAAIAHRPSPALLAPASSASTRPVERDFLRLSDLTTREERYRDSEEDAAHPSATPFEVGRTYGQRWRERATTLAVSAVAALEPQIPRLIDAELLGYAERRGVNTWGPEEIKHAVRSGFWAALRH